MESTGEYSSAVRFYSCMKHNFSLVIVVLIGLANFARADCLNTNEVTGSRIAISLANRAPTAVGSSGGPFISLDPETGNYFILKTFSSPSGDPSRPFDIQTVEGQLFDFTGRAISAPIVFESGYFLSEPFGTATGIAFNSARKEFLVTWLVRFKNSAVQPDIRHQLRGQIVSARGEFVGSKQVILQTNPTNVSLHFHASVYEPSKGRFVILYSFLNALSTRENLFVRGLDNQGKRVGSSTKVNTQSTGIITGPEIKRDPHTNRFLAAWNSTSNGTQNVLQLIDSSLTKIGPNRILTMPNSEPGPPQIAYLDSTDGFVVFWNLGFTETIQARIISPEGSFNSAIIDLQLKGFLEDARFNPDTNKFLILYRKR